MKPLRIWFEEEYGYRNYIWTYPGTKRQLINDYVAGKAPLKEKYNGLLTEVQIVLRNRKPGIKTFDIVDRDDVVHPEQDPNNDFDGKIHYHELRDSFLKIDGVHLEGLPGHVTLDAVTALSLVAEDA